MLDVQHGDHHGEPVQSRPRVALGVVLRVVPRVEGAPDEDDDDGRNLAPLETLAVRVIAEGDADERGGAEDDEGLGVETGERAEI